MTDIIAPTLLTVTPPSWGELGVYAAAFLTLIGVIYTATATRRTGREANAITAAEKLWGRVDQLEKRERDREESDRCKEQRMDELEASQKATDQKLQETLSILSIALEFIDKLYRWGRQGGGEPEPTIPERLRDWLGHLTHKEN